MTVELYIYFKLPAPLATPWLREALRAWQRERCDTLPGLQARLLERPLPDGVRHDDPAATRTWMEIYRLPPGLAATDPAAQSLGSGPPWLSGPAATPRHVEVFVEMVEAVDHDVAPSRRGA